MIHTIMNNSYQAIDARIKDGIEAYHAQKKPDFARLQRANRPSQIPPQNALHPNQRYEESIIDSLHPSEMLH